MTMNASQILPLIVLLPLLGAAINGFLGRSRSRRFVHVIGVGSVGIAFVLAVRAFFALKGIAAENHVDPNISSTLYTWVSTGFFHFDVAFFLDPLSSVLLLVVTGVGLLIHIFSMGYMSHDKDYARYFAYLNLFMFSMLVLILGKNLLMLFVGWEGVGLCSYLLIGFWFTDDKKAQAGQKAFIVNRIGDFGFMIGIILLLYFCKGTTDFGVMEMLSVTSPNGPFDDPVVLTFCCCLLFVGAVGKSAQIPLYVWLPDAMAGPTPVSALIHAATMVTAGVYMIARLSFLYTLSPISMGLIAVVGASTAVFAAIIALKQRDIKKVLAYSTVSQLGYMIMAVGIGAYVAGIFHLMTHAFFKALLFLGAGSVIHAMSGEQNIFKMGGLKRKMPITRVTFLIATLAISGVPLLSGFFSKDEILWETKTRMQRIDVPAVPEAVWADPEGDVVIIGGQVGAIVTRKGEAWTGSKTPMVRVRLQSGKTAADKNWWPTLRAMTRTPNGTLWAAADNGYIFRNDGGGWTVAYRAKSPVKGNGLRAVYAAGDNDVWFGGGNGQLIHFNGKGFQFNTLGAGGSGRSPAVTGLTGKSGNEVYAAVGDDVYRFDGKAWRTTGLARQNPAGPVQALVVGPHGQVTAVTCCKADSNARNKTVQPMVQRLISGQWGNEPLNGIKDVNIVWLSAAAADKKALYLGGKARVAGRLMSVLLRKEGTDWTVVAGDSSSSIRRIIPTAKDIIVTAGVGRAGQVLTVKNGKLVGAQHVPHKPWFHIVLYIMALSAAAMTAFYMFRLYFLTFEGETRADPEVWAHAHESPRSMTVPLMLLAVLSVFGGYIGTPLFENVSWLSGVTNKFHDWLHPVFAVADSRMQAVHDLGLAWKYAGISTAVAGAGIFLAWLLYLGPLKAKSGAPAKPASGIAGWFERLVFNKFYVDEFYDKAVVSPFRSTAKFFHRFVDEIVIDLVLVRGSGFVVQAAGKVVRVVQNGQVQQYAVGIVVGVAALIWLMGG